MSELSVYVKEGRGGHSVCPDVEYASCNSGKIVDRAVADADLVA